MNVKQSLANRNNYGNRRDLRNIKYIVIHYTGNDGDSDEGNANYFKGDRGVSAHYFVDDNSITQTVPDDFVAWSVGGKKYNDCAKTGGGKWYGICTNSNSISIELCDSVKNGKFDFTDNTIAQAVELTKDLMKKYSVPIENVIRHFDVNGKICPLPFVRQPAQWNAFKAKLHSTEDKDLYEACRVLILSGINININCWKRENLMKLTNVPSLISKLGGLDSLIEKGIVTNISLWKDKKYNTTHVRSLIVKTANYINKQSK